MLGATLALDIATAPCRAVVQSGGWALRISPRQLRLELNHCPRLRQTLKRYLYLLLTQWAQAAVCGRFHEVEPRLARWLLMTADCSHADSFYLTHAYLADLLGVRRSGVTIAAGALQARGLIQYRRGHITILDHAGLQRAACECYAAMRESYARLFTAATQG
ncbi:helix-turn-helix domain-containing protein [Pseudomonas sp. CAU 1711]|uniref:Crp/Fnr family transcriptional regulator n=1 Tax=Pseudomonas sp. CAU 1711 TaxID=3140356 RepID=UPI00326077DE